MTPDRWQRIKELRESALALPEHERESFLRSQCGQDAGLFQNVWDLLEDVPGILDDIPVSLSPPAQILTFREGELISGRYRIARFLARGGMGEVYEALDTELGGTVALKTVRPEIASDLRFVSRFRQEIQLSRKVTHPNVCRLFDVARHVAPDGGMVTYLTMELLQGETLAQKLRRDGRMEAPQAEPLVLQIAAGLAAVHQAGVLHRDFKSSNVMLTGNGARAVIMDFGLARLTDPSLRETSSTEIGVMLGTPDYMAPEQLEGHEVTTATDIYALGIVIYEMLTGARPFQERTPIAAAVQRMRDPPPSVRAVVPEIDARWERVVRTCLERDPRRRFANTEEFFRALSGGALPYAPRLAWLAPTRRWPALAASVAILGSLGLLGWSFYPRQANPPSPEAIRWYRTGTDFVQAGCYFAATKALQEAVTIKPDFALAHARLAQSWDALHFTEAAQAEMLKAVSPNSDLAGVSAADRLLVDGIQFTIGRDYAAATRAFEKLRSAVEASRTPEIEMDLGNTYEQSRKLDLALESFRAAAKGPPRSAGSFLRLGNILARQAKWPEAARAYNEAEAMYSAASNQEGMTELLLAEGNSAMRSNQVDQALRFTALALATARQTGNFAQTVRAGMKMSNLELTLNHIESSRKFAEDALDLAQSKGMERLAASGLLYLGSAMQMKDDAAGAIEYFQRSLQVARKVTDSYGQAGALAKLADVHISQDQLDLGAQEAQEALKLFQPGANSIEVGQCLTLLGRAERKRGHLAQALARFQELIALARQQDDQSEIAFAHESLGSVLREQGNFPEALNHFRLSMQLSTSLGEKLRSEYAAAGYADMLSRLGQSAESRELLSRTMAAAGDNRPLLDSLRFIRANAMLAAGDYTGCLRECRRLAAQDAPGGVREMAELHRMACLAGTFSGRPDARLHCSQALQLARRLGYQPLRLQVVLAGAESCLHRREWNQAWDYIHPEEAAFQDAPESQWRALAVAARALAGRGERAHAGAYARLAKSSLDSLDRSWGTATLTNYLSRPDIAENNRHVLELLNANQ